MIKSNRDSLKVLFMFGAIPHYYNKVLNRLNKLDNLEIIVVIPSNKSKTIGEGVKQEITGVNFQVIELSEYHTYYRKSFFLGFRKFMEDNDFDVIVTIWPYILGFFFYPNLFFLLRRKKIKIIFKDIPFQVPFFQEGLKLKIKELWHESSIKKKLNLFERIFFAFSTLMRRIMYLFIDAHVNYTEQAYDILESYGVDKGKIFITYNSPDTEKLFKAKEKAQELGGIKNYKNERIIHVGRLVKWKRVDLLIQSVSILKEKYKKIELLIIGTGPEEANLKILTSILNLNNNVEFIGGVYDPVTLGRYYKSCSLYVLAGMGGLSINEAMIFGKPVICSVCDGTEKKLVRDEFNGKYFKEGDEIDLAKKIEYLINDSQRIKEMGKNSEQIIKNEINIATVIKGYIRAFNFVSKDKYNLVYNNLN